jgi:hypothetical protein
MVNEMGVLERESCGERMAGSTFLYNSIKEFTPSIADRLG